MSHARSALISGPGFFLDLRKARPLVNSSPQPGGPVCKARSIIGLKSFTFSVSGYALAVRIEEQHVLGAQAGQRAGQLAVAVAGGRAFGTGDRLSVGRVAGR